jgi:hypothetical protein
MRWSLALVLVGCTGGQTGEITTLTMCEELVARVPITELPSETAALLEVALEPKSAELAWVEGDSTAIEVDASTEGETADRLGPYDCAETVRVPARIHASTGDGRIDVTVPGFIDLTDGSALVFGFAGVTSLNGRDPLAAEVQLSIWMELRGSVLTGDVSIDGEPAASF